MPTYSFTNARGTGPRGVNRMSGGTALVQVGQTRELPVHSREIVGLDAYFDIEMVSDEPRNPDAPLGTEYLAREPIEEKPAPLSEGDEAELIDAMNDAELRDFIFRKIGKHPHPNTKTATLVEKAKEAANG